MKKTENKFIIFYFISYLIFSFCITNFTPFLSAIGFNPFQRGIILSGIAIVAILLQLYFGYLSDRLQTVKRIALVSLIIYLFGVIFIFNHNINNYSIQLIIVSFVGGFSNAFTGLYDIWVLGMNETVQNMLSFIKGFGSFGWAIGSLISSYIIMNFYYGGLRISLILLTLVLIFITYNIPDVSRIKEKEAINRNDINNLLRRKDFTLLILSLVLMYSLITAKNSIVIDKMIYFNASRYQISLNWFFSSIVEIPMYLMGGKLYKKFKPIRLLQISSLVLVIQFISYSFSTTNRQIILISILQLFTTPIIMVASKLIILEITPRYLLNTGQMVALSIFTGLPSLFVPVVSGYLSITFGYDISLALLSIVGIIAFFITILFTKIRPDRIN